MPATERHACAEALDIDVSDNPLPEDASAETEAIVRVLPQRPGTELMLALASEPFDPLDEIDPYEGLDPFAEYADGEWDDEDNVLLEPSDLLEVEAARTGAGLSFTPDDEVLIDIDMVDGEADFEFVDDPVEVAAEGVEAEADEAESDEAESIEAEADAESDEAESDEAESDEAESDEAEADAESDEPESDEPESLTPADPIRAPFWRGLNTGLYAFVRGLRGMGQSPLVQLLAIGTMAVCMLLLGTTMLIFTNASRVAHDLGVDTPVTIYMQPGIEPLAAEDLRTRVAALPEVARAELVSPTQALGRLREGVGNDPDGQAELLAGVDPELLPHSVEVQLVAGVEPGFADALATRVQDMDGVDEVSVLGPWVQQVERMLTTLRWLAFGVAGLVSLACLAIVWSTIRLGVFARRAEIQILRLVGGTGRFVRGPFVVEGVVQGLLGTALALAGLWLAFDLIGPFLERGMSLLFAAGSLRFFTTLEIALALAFGGMIGIIGSRAAVARHAEA